MGSASYLVSAYAEKQPSQFAQALARHGGTSAIPLLKGLPASVMAAVVINLPSTMAQDLLDSVNDEDLVTWLVETELDIAIRFARRLGNKRRTGLSEALPKGRRNELEKYCAFPDKSVGAYIDPVFNSINESQTISEAMTLLGTLGDSDTTPLLIG